MKHRLMRLPGSGGGVSICFLMLPVTAPVYVPIRDLPFNRWLTIKIPAEPLPPKGQSKGLAWISGKTSYPWRLGA